MAEEGGGRCHGGAFRRSWERLGLIARRTVDVHANPHRA
ncbi:hypothetical protein FM106_05085 [Brachybacterium faecium]|nr:hypothetical protein FM106_05085 [Brachybacterium faecium]